MHPNCPPGYPERYAARLPKCIFWRFHRALRYNIRMPPSKEKASRSSFGLATCLWCLASLCFICAMNARPHSEVLDRDGAIVAYSRGWPLSFGGGLTINRPIPSFALDELLHGWAWALAGNLVVCLTCSLLAYIIFARLIR
jgi:hypothetical protein